MKQSVSKLKANEKKYFFIVHNQTMEPLPECITELVRLEGTLKDYLVQCFVGKGVYMRMSGTLSNNTLKNFSDGDFTVSLKRLFQ